MESTDFYEGLKTDADEDKSLVDAAEHFVRLKMQVGLRQEPEDDIEKLAELPEAHKGDASPRTYDLGGSPAVAWDGRKGYNYTAVQHEGKHHTLVDHHASGRVGHIIMHPETGVVEHSEVHPSHRHMTGKFHEHAAVLHHHLKQAHGQTKTAFEIEPEDRTGIPKKDFAQPGKEEAGHRGKYPIPDRQHARTALGFAKMHHDAGALAAVKKKIHQKFPDMDVEGRGGEEKDSCMGKLGTAMVRLGFAKLSNVPGVGAGGGSTAGIKAPTPAMPSSGTVAGPKAPSMPKMAALANLLTQEYPTVHGKAGSAIAQLLLPTEPEHHKHHHKEKKADISMKTLGAIVGSSLLAGGTYMASAPMNRLKGKSRAEAEAEDVVKGQKAVGERDAGITKKLKNRFNEFNLGIAKAFREHPVKAALINAGPGALLGYSAAKALGAK